MQSIYLRLHRGTKLETLVSVKIKIYYQILKIPILSRGINVGTSDLLAILHNWPSVTHGRKFIISVKLPVNASIIPMTRIRVPFELYEMNPEFYQGFFHVLAQCIVCTITWLTRQGSIDLLVHILYSPPPSHRAKNLCHTGTSWRGKGRNILKYVDHCGRRKIIDAAKISDDASATANSAPPSVDFHALGGLGPLFQT